MNATAVSLSVEYSPPFPRPAPSAVPAFPQLDALVRYGILLKQALHLVSPTNEDNTKATQRPKGRQSAFFHRPTHLVLATSAVLGDIHFLEPGTWMIIGVEGCPSDVHLLSCAEPVFHFMQLCNDVIFFSLGFKTPGCFSL